MRRALIRAGAEPVFDALDGWLASNEHLWARARVVDDPESEEPWRELVVEIAVDADTDRVRALWGEVARLVQRAEQQLDEALRGRMATDFGVHMVWGALVGRRE